MRRRNVDDSKVLIYVIDFYLVNRPMTHSTRPGGKGVFEFTTHLFGGRLRNAIEREGRIDDSNMGGAR